MRTSKKKVCNFVGGVSSPLLANIALHGLEEDTKEALKLILTRSAKPYHQGWERARRTLQVIRYADDFVVIHKELSVIKEGAALLERGRVDRKSINYSQ